MHAPSLSKPMEEYLLRVDISRALASTVTLELCATCPQGRWTPLIHQLESSRSTFDLTPFHLVQRVLLASDGKALVLGHVSGSDAGVAVARILPGGSLDSTYGMGGTSVVELPPPTPFIEDAALQTDGKALLCGSASTGAVSAHFTVFRFNSNGGLDPSFDADGRATVVPIDATSGRCHSIALQVDGKVVAGGSYYPNGGGETMLVARFHADGALDRSFAGTGYLTLPPPAAETNGSLHAVALQSDGKIVVASTSGPSGKALLSRLLTNGGPDTGFGNGGLKIVDVDPGIVGDLLIQPDGRYLLIGSSNSQFAVARIWP